MRLVFRAVFAVALLSSPALADPVLRTTLGVVDGGGQDGGRFWFELDRIDQRFVLDLREVAAMDEVVKALKASTATGRAVSVHYFVDGATFGMGESKPSFIVHDITYDGHNIAAEQTLPAQAAGPAPSDRDKAAAQLAEGIALAGDADAAPSRRALSAAIDSTALEQSLKALALKTRAELNDGDALQNWMPGNDRDKLFIASLADARAWQSLSPADSHAAAAVARALAVLGAYDEAIALYRDMIRNWPQQNFWQEIRIAAIYRTMGRYDRSLAELDTLAKSGDGNGMGYHYHRGWTLSAAGRYGEAVAEFTEGLKDQPDFGGAFMRRACALARTGKLKEAIADERETIKSLSGFGNDTPPSPSLRHDQDRSAEILKTLETAYARDANAVSDAPCTGYWDWGDDGRTRSPLLPPVKP
jgi:tetratricopeptide (TPR) repeat protein